jgi:uncharacterized protein (DUF1501 family)
MDFTRRNFMKSASALTLTSLLPTVWLRAGAANALELCEIQGRNLVIVQLEGGNDATNMVIPTSGAYRGIYEAARPLLGIDEVHLAATALGSDPGGSGSDLSLHPLMPALKSLHDSGNLATILGAHYADGSDSHFSSERVWYMGNPNDRNGSGNGWMAGVLEKVCGATLPGNIPALPAADLERELTPLFKGSDKVVSIESLENLGFPVLPIFDSQQADLFRAIWSYAQETALADSNPFPRAIAGSVLPIFERLEQFQLIDLSQGRNLNDLINGTSLGTGGFGAGGRLRTPTNLAQQMRQVFAILRGGPPGVPLGPRIFRVHISDFDSHSNQGRFIPLASKSIAARRQDSFSQERHSRLLYSVDQTIGAFWQDCVDAGIADRTAVMVFSEFSRRVTENTTDPSSAGTDHGTLGHMFFVGPNASQVAAGQSCVQGGLHGPYPDLTDLTDDQGGNYKFFSGQSVDFRDVYAEIMTSWLDVSSSDTQEILSDYAASPLGFVQTA